MRQKLQGLLGIVPSLPSRLPINSSALKKFTFVYFSMVFNMEKGPGRADPGPWSREIRFLFSLAALKRKAPYRDTRATVRPTSARDPLRGRRWARLAASPSCREPPRWENPWHRARTASACRRRTQPRTHASSRRFLEQLRSARWAEANHRT